MRFLCGKNVQVINQNKTQKHEKLCRKMGKINLEKIAKKRTNTHSIFNKGKYILKQRLLKREKKRQTEIRKIKHQYQESRCGEQW